MESAVTRIQRLELKSAVGLSQPQLVSGCRNPGQPWDGVSRNSYPAAAGTRVSRTMESEVTCIQPQLVSSRWNASQPQDRISRNSYWAAFQKLIFY